MNQTAKLYWPLILLGTIAGIASFSVFAVSQEEADENFARENWKDASLAYTELLQTDKLNANNWFNLALARHELNDFPGAAHAYGKAIESGYQPQARARYNLARVFMSLDEPQQALHQLEELAKVGGPNYRVVQNAPEFAPLIENPRFLAMIQALKPCSAAEHRQFDFWLGLWDVTPSGSEQPTAVNRISSEQDGCVVLEQYTHGAFTGMSLNFYDTTTQLWHQTWMSNAGGAVYLEGGLDATGAMEMSDVNLPVSSATGTINRVRWTSNEDDSVRQHWQNSSDLGVTWTTVFDGIYTRKQD